MAPTNTEKTKPLTHYLNWDFVLFATGPTNHIFMSRELHYICNNIYSTKIDYAKMSLKCHSIMFNLYIHVCHIKVRIK